MQHSANGLADEGTAINAQLQSSAFSDGIFGVPSYVVGSDVYFGRENLPRVHWQIAGQNGPTPDIGNPLPVELLALPQPPSQVTIGIDDSLDSLLALPQLFKLLSNYSGSLSWVMIEASKTSAPTSYAEGSRSALHMQWREKNRQLNLDRYDSTGSASQDYATAIEQLLQQNQISAKKEGPEQVIRPATVGIVVLLDDELLIGRQHLPLIAARLNTAP